MNRAMRRASEANGRREQRKEWEEFEDVTSESRRRHAALNPGSAFRPDQVFQNPKYVVQIFNDRKVIGRPARQVMIRRSDSAPIYSWSDMQRIKNEIFGEEVEALQMFPKESELVDVANLYWMWVLP